MNEKICICCQRLKPLNDFYKHPKMADGHLNKCKGCQKAATKKNRDDKADYYKEYDRKRANNPDRVAARREYRNTEEGKIAHDRAIKNYRRKYPMKYAAHNVVNNAIRDGKLINPQAYESCGSSHKVEAHHDDYTKPLVVRWLCEECHKEWHRNNEPRYE